VKIYETSRFVTVPADWFQVDFADGLAVQIFLDRDGCINVGVKNGKPDYDQAAVGAEELVDALAKLIAKTNRRKR
jgi:hypothetical protein